MKDIMFDIETLGKGKNAVILQIGACYFDRYTGEIPIGKTFFRNIDLEDSLSKGFEVSASNVQWWMSQSKETQSTLFNNTKPIKQVLEELNEFIEKGNVLGWSHATFDFPILTNAYQKLDIKFKLHYRCMRDIRTLVDITKYKKQHKVEREGIHHNALADCVYQCKYVSKAFQKLQRYRDGKKEKHDCFEWSNEGQGCSICSKRLLNMTKQDIIDIQDRCNEMVNSRNTIISKLQFKLKEAKQEIEKHKVKASHFEMELFSVKKKLISKLKEKI